MTKPILYRQNNAQQAKENVVNCLYFVLEKVLQLLHPFMPFVTEEIWRTACGHDDSIMVSHFPTELVRFEAAEKDMQYVIDAITCIRSIRGELNIPASLELDAFIKTHDRAISVVLRNNLDAIMKLTRSKETTIGRAVMRPKGAAVCVKGDFEIYIPLKGLIDVESEIQRLLKEKAKTDETLVVINRKLKSEDFLKGAPRDVVEKEKVLFDELIRKGEKIEEHIKLLKTV
jgi:valyl-tRNA synthetase